MNFIVEGDILILKDGTGSLGFRINTNIPPNEIKEREGEIKALLSRLFSDWNIVLDRENCLPRQNCDADSLWTYFVELS